MSKQSHPNQPTKEQVLEWIEAYQKTEDEEAQTNLVLNYRRLVESIARK